MRLGRKSQYDQIYQQIKTADETLAAHFGKKTYTKEEVAAIKTEDQGLAQAQQIANYMFSNGMDSIADALQEIEDGLTSINDRLNVNLNKDLKGRVTGDNPDDMSTKFYGNGNVNPIKKSESHGTHVAGIIAAERNNGKGANGVANHAKIMAVRAEYYSPHSDWVREAIAYAGKNDVLIVNAAGNESTDLDTKDVYPNDAVGVGAEVSDTFISVGALEPKYGSGMIAGFSNYGKVNVDVFAPGAKVYSTTPENEYKTKGGTSMAAPGVAGIAALVRSYYPNLSAAQVKQIIMDSGLALNTKVIVGGNSEDIRPFADLSKSTKIVNAYNALIMAAKTSN